MSVKDKNVLVLGGGGMVGQALCRELLACQPARLVIASRRQSKACGTVKQLEQEFPNTSTQLIPVWGDIFLRTEWQSEGDNARAAVLAEPEKRRRLIADILDPLDEDIISSSMLVNLVLGTASGLNGAKAQVVADCMNTATAVSYQNVYSSASRLADLARTKDSHTDWPTEVETLLASLYVPQLVRHVQLLYEAMRRADTQAYVKVGTSGTGGMGFNIPFTHGEEKPSRLLLSKTAMAGAQSLLNFLMARTPDAPAIVKEVKPTALIGWKAIEHGVVRRHGSNVLLYDCPLDQAVSVRDTANLTVAGNYGVATGETLQGVYIDTGENGKFSAAEFSVITALGLMELVTPEEVARNAVRELNGTSTGHDVIAALDASVMGPSFRGAHLRQAALERLQQLETEHGESVAFEILGPPRLSKLLFEAYLLKSEFKTIAAVTDCTPEEIATTLDKKISNEKELRQRVISIGIPILLSDGESLLRGPVIKSEDAYHGWVDLTPANIKTWQNRLRSISEAMHADVSEDTSSRADRLFCASRHWCTQSEFPDLGETVAWIFIHEDQGVRGKN
ncbi:polysaccharide biosynthesis protein [Kaarinaea lacus]